MAERVSPRLAHNRLWRTDVISFRPLDAEAIQDEKAKMDEEHDPGHLQDSSDDEEEVDWKDLNEETTVEDLMDRYAAGDCPCLRCLLLRYVSRVKIKLADRV